MPRRSLWQHRQAIARR